MVKRDLGIKVEVTRTAIHEHSGLPIKAWLVTTATGYRAEINECPCGLWVHMGTNYATGENYGHAIVNCLCRSDACRRKPSRKSYVCHGWHQARVDKFVEQLAKVPTRRKVDLPSRAGYVAHDFIALEGSTK